MTELPKRVLVVDDDAGIRELLGSVLRRHALIVDMARDGAEALELIRNNTYAVVLLDLLMPNVDGFTVLDTLRDPMKASPVILVVTGSDRSALERVDASRVHGVVRKPFDAEELALLVVACADIKSRSTFGTMAIATMIAGGPILALLNRLS